MGQSRFIADAPTPTGSGQALRQEVVRLEIDRAAQTGRIDPDLDVADASNQIGVLPPRRRHSNCPRAGIDVERSRGRVTAAV